MHFLQTWARGAVPYSESLKFRDSHLAKLPEDYISPMKRGTLVRLGRDFYDRDPRAVSRDLLGKMLVRPEGRVLLKGRIVEAEAYLGADDPTAHAAAGSTTSDASLYR